MKNVTFLTSFLIFLLSKPLYSASSLDDWRWFLSPAGQEISIDIDNLHTEVIRAEKKMDFGFKDVQNLNFKENIRIAVIDSGIDIEHPDIKDFTAFNEKECFNGNTIPPMEEDRDRNGLKGDCAGWNFVDDDNRAEDETGHGTHVTGIITTILRNYSSSVKIIPIKAFSGDHQSNKNKMARILVKSIEYAIAQNAHIIHLSAGWPNTLMTRKLERTIKKALDLDMAIIAAAGNSSQRATIYPCQLKGVICVGALRANGEMARFSNWGSQVDFFAPGEKILSSIPKIIPSLYIKKTGYDYKNGTSQAAPFLTASWAIMKGLHPHLNNSEIYGHLKSSSHKISESLDLFNIKEAIKLNQKSYLHPDLKNLHSVVKQEDNQIYFSFKIKELLKAKSKNNNEIKDEVPQAVIKCQDLKDRFNIEDDNTLHYNGILSTHHKDKIDCLLKLNSINFKFQLKILENLPLVKRESTGIQDEKILVMKTNKGTITRFLTIPTLKGYTPGPYYYYRIEKKTFIYDSEKKLGVINDQNKCKVIRLWQYHSALAREINFLVESHCKDYLKYHFYDKNLTSRFGEVKFTPKYSIINYDDFEIIESDIKNPPSIRFIAVGTAPAPTSPWEDGDHYRNTRRLYEIYPQREDSTDKKMINYKTKVIDHKKKWTKDLGFRYVPQFSIVDYHRGKLLVRALNKTIWIDVKSQKANFASLDFLIIANDDLQDISQYQNSILQTLLTPYEYRGHIIDGVTLRFKQDDIFDPLFNILSTRKTKDGFITYIQSFQNLWAIYFDHFGQIIVKEKTTIDRFDFISLDQQLAGLSQVILEDKTIFLLNGTRLHTNYLDVLSMGSKISYKLPSTCAALVPVLEDQSPHIPLFCIKDKKEFKFKMIPLK